MLLSIASLLTIGCSNEIEGNSVRVIPAAETGMALTAQGPIDRAGGASIGIVRVDPYVTYLVDADDRALYLFTPDEDLEESSCVDECAEAWPPFVTNGVPVAREPAVDEILLDTITREDGSEQVTYDGWPLYYYAGDEEPGDTSGHGIESFDGEWFLVSPEGEPVERSVGGY